MASQKRAGSHDDKDDESMPPALGEGCELPLSFSIGAAVHCDDGAMRAADTRRHRSLTDRVTALIVEKGFLQREDRVVPVMAVKSASDDQIVLGMHSSALRDLQEYREVDFRAPVERWDRGRYQPEQTRYAVSPYEAAVGSGVCSLAPVPVPRRCALQPEGQVAERRCVMPTKVFGEVDHVLVDCEGQYITYLIVRQGLFSDYVIVPVDAIVEVDDAGILLTLARDEVRTLPRYDRA